MGYEDDLNLYQYVRNDPLNGTDPTGRATKCDTFAYDTASRLTGLTQNLAGTVDDQTLGFAYTPASQISQRTASNDNYNWTPPEPLPVTTNYVANGLNQYTSVGGVAFTYAPGTVSAAISPPMARASAKPIPISARAWRPAFLPPDRRRARCRNSPPRL